MTVAGSSCPVLLHPQAPARLGSIPDRSPPGFALLVFCWRAEGRSAWTRTFVPAEIRIDQSHNLSAQGLILLKVFRVEDLEPDFEIRIANQNGRILLVAVSRAVHEPALVRARVFWMEVRIQALDKVPGEMIVDLRAIVFAKDDPRLAARIPDDVLPIPSGAGDEEGPL